MNGAFELSLVRLIELSLIGMALSRIKPQDRLQTKMVYRHFFKENKILVLVQNQVLLFRTESQNSS